MHASILCFIGVVIVTWGASRFIESGDGDLMLSLSMKNGDSSIVDRLKRAIHEKLLYKGRIKRWESEGESHGQCNQYEVSFVQGVSRLDDVTKSWQHTSERPHTADNVVYMLLWSVFVFLGL